MLGPGAGDNAAAALGLGVGPGDCVVSLGTSGVVSAVGDAAPHDAAGLVAGFADATGRQLPAGVHAQRRPVLAAVAKMLGVDFDEFDRLALSAPAGCGWADAGAVLRRGALAQPARRGGRAARRDDPKSCGRQRGPGRGRGSARSMEFCIAQIAGQGVDVGRVILVGGGARSEAVRRIAPAILGVPVHVPTPAEYVALGAARQAAWTLSQSDEPPAWSLGDTASYTAEPTPVVLDQYRAAQPLTLGRSR